MFSLRVVFQEMLSGRCLLSPCRMYDWSTDPSPVSRHLWRVIPIVSPSADIRLDRFPSPSEHLEGDATSARPRRKVMEVDKTNERSVAGKRPRPPNQYQASMSGKSEEPAAVIIASPPHAAARLRYASPSSASTMPLSLAGAGGVEDYPIPSPHSAFEVFPFLSHRSSEASCHLEGEAVARSRWAGLHRSKAALTTPRERDLVTYSSAT